jgi:hypothetical protein
MQIDINGRKFELSKKRAEATSWEVKKSEKLGVLMKYLLDEGFITEVFNSDTLLTDYEIIVAKELK